MSVYSYYPSLYDKSGNVRTYTDNSGVEEWRARCGGRAGLEATGENGSGYRNSDGEDNTLHHPSQATPHA